MKLLTFACFWLIIFSGCLTGSPLDHRNEWTVGEGICLLVAVFVAAWILGWGGNKS